MSEASTGHAVALLSGGLDSILAARLVLEQGIRVTGINFAGAYCPVPFGEKSAAEKAAGHLGIELVVLPINEDFIELVKVPHYGRGKNMNPCIDCHILMIRKAWEWGQANGADFVVTGEVLGQRPMSQNRQALGIVARRSGTEGRLLRPMSARLLEPTAPEESGLVDRARLLDIEGRSRKKQMALAEEFDITEYPTPAGGCLLTDVGYGRRVKEALEHGEDSVEVFELLRTGRHFRLPSGARVIVGRNKDDNDELRRRAPDRAAVIDGQALPGPLALLIPDTEGDRETAAALCARYSDRRKDENVAVRVNGEQFNVRPASPEDSARLVIE
jgi:tRNA U34 2-thiouridine synthase MnmA/TrmU